jgi:predicted RNA-binding Zn-ribbon protein involved in translation (DUF1610 family)
VTVEQVDLDRCPTCGTALGDQTVTEPALLRHGGYGASRETTVTACPGCGWHITRQINEVRPT